MKKLLLLIVVTLPLCLSATGAEIARDKRQEIEKMLRLTGMESLMSQMKTQMVASLRMQLGQALPESFWTKIQDKMDTRELIERIMPVYDRYYTLEDLKAVNAFYESPVGQKVLASLPRVVQESMKIGQEWGEKIGREVAADAERELNKNQQK